MLIVLKNALFFLFTFDLYFYPCPLFDILKMLLSFFILEQYIFTCVFKFSFHTCYFFLSVNAIL